MTETMTEIDRTVDDETKVYGLLVRMPRSSANAAVAALLAAVADEGTVVPPPGGCRARAERWEDQVPGQAKAGKLFPPPEGIYLLSYQLSHKN